jgi:Tfp pilus assembly protein PilO
VSGLGRGSVVLALLVVVTAVIWLGLVPVAERELARETRLLATVREAARGAPATRTVPQRPDALSAFEQRLANEDDRMRLMKQIWQLGAAAGLQLNRVDYHTEVDAGGRFNRLLITLPMTGSYPAVRKLMFTLMAEFLGLSLDKIDMKREQTTSAEVETSAHMTLHTRP